MSAEALELTFDTARHVHIAPLPSGRRAVYSSIDDLGRQRMSLNTILNRWIQLMETGADTFALQSSEVITLPLDATLVFSTNLELADLMDEAYLRRITCKIPVREPTQDEFLEIAVRACRNMNIEPEGDALSYLVTRLYSLADVEPMSCYARDLIQIAADTGTYYDRPVRLDRETIDWAIRLYLGARGQDWPSAAPVGERG